MSAIFSPTRLKSFVACPQRHMFDVSADQPQDPKPYFEVGRAIHTFVERYTLQMWETKQDMDNEIAEDLLEEVRSELDPALWDDFEEVARTYLESHLIAPQPQVGGLETKLAIDYNHEPCDFDQPEALLRGIIDRWWISDGVMLISDTKSNRIIQSRDQVENDVQLLCYAYLAWIHHQEDVGEVRVQLDFVRRTDAGQNPVLIHAVFPVSRLEKMRSALNAKANEYLEILEGNVKPACRPGLEYSHCGEYGGCPHLHMCPHWDGYAPPDMITSDEEAAALQAWSKHNKAATYQADKKVKAWVDARGEVEGHGLKTKIGVSKSYNYDGQKVWEALEARGRTAEDFAKMATVKAGLIPSSIKKEIQEDLEHTYNGRVTTTKA